MSDRSVLHRIRNLTDFVSLLLTVTVKAQNPFFVESVGRVFSFRQRRQQTPRLRHAGGASGQ